MTPTTAQRKKLSISLLFSVDEFCWLNNLIKYPPMIKAATYARPYQRISKRLKETMTGSIEGCIKIIIFN